MTLPPPDGSRDRRIEDPSNLALIHPAARALLPQAIRWGVSANAVSIAGLAVGAGAALAFARWQQPAWVLAGLCAATAWLVFDGLDGMVARATGTASPLGRLLDGVCDHGVFVLIYVLLAVSIGTAGGWALAIVAGAFHAAQSSLYEAERARFHRRVRGDPGAAPLERTGNAVERGYDRMASALDRHAAVFDRRLAEARDPVGLGRIYGQRAAPAMRAMIPLTANTRIGLIVLACLAGDPRLFWWAEIGPLTLVAALALTWHRRIEAGLLRSPAIRQLQP